MKSHLLNVRATEGQEAFYDQIRNSVAGCRQKWKTMPKVDL